MLRLRTSNRLEALVDGLAEDLAGRSSPLETAAIVVPGRSVERYVELRLAERLGIASSLRFLGPRELVATTLSGASGRPILEDAAIEARLLEILSAPLGDPALVPVRRWLEAGGPARTARERRVVTLAQRLSRLFTEYDLSRPDVVRRWLEGETSGWQPALFRAVRSLGPDALTVAEALRELRHVAPPPEPLHVLSIRPSGPVEHAVLGALAATADLHVHALDACREFWEDAERPRALAAEGGSLDGEGAGLLGRWGRPMREHLVALREMSGWSAEERWAVPEGTSVLSALQRALLDRSALAAAAPDRSVRFLGCPSVRREVETIATEIWAAALRDGTTFADVAVILHDEARARYLPHLEAVFSEAREIPWSSRDLGLARSSAVAQAAMALVTFVSSEPSRALLFDAILSPVVVASSAGATRERWQTLVSAVGFVRGLSAADHEGTYVGAGAASLDLEQAIRRLALGALMPGQKSGEERFVPTEPPLLPEEIGLGDEAALGLLALLRSLAGDVRFARTARLSLEEWARFFSAIVGAHIAPRSPTEEAELVRVRGAIASIAQRHREGTSLGAAAAAELCLAEIGGMTTQRGSPGVSGVSVGSLRSLRGLPFRHVFVLGLGEGRFPPRDEESGLDVRDGAPRRRGDVHPADDARLAMLETVLAARDALVLSWVARAEDSGDPISPSSIVLELQAELGAAAPGVERPPLRRHEALGGETDEDRLRAAALPGAVLEAGARALGDRERDPTVTWPRAAEAVRGLDATDGLRSLLSWPRIDPSPPDPSLAVEITLADLRAFLERPLQAAAQRALGREETEEGEGEDDEPLDTGAQARQRVIERALVLFLRAPEVPLADRVAHETELLRAAGRFPFGVLGERERASLGRTAEALATRLRASGGARPLFRARLGRGRATRDGIERVSDPLALGAGKDGRALVLSGETGLLFDAARTSVVVVPREPRGGEAGERERTRHLLRAFVDHAALSAAGLAGDEARTVWVVHPSASYRGVLEPIAAPAARTWLRTLGAELARGSAAFLPIEAVLLRLDAVRGRSSRPADELHRAVERVREKDAGGAERWGPVRDAVLRDGLDPIALLRAVGQRFGPFVEHLRSSIDLVEAP